ncbi:uncharacterized protein si:dkey-250k15.4 [Dicentrarchus labrax]|uniref:uncharacterized protein si:dkey-250k15.4 n=1 Tax=Dicentrarchus labrax TaxID=13489 RepID=UPI0021F687B8|nr:uncharacterized protein si:dkey-250k15.4 [Dicentrarchus labrax]
MRRFYLLVCVNGLVLLVGVRESCCCAKKHVCGMLPSNDRFTCGQKDDCGQFRIQCSMICVRGRATSDKEKTLNVFKKQLKTADKNCCSVNRFTADCKCSNHYIKTDAQHRTKRLKSRKERSQMRGAGKEASKSKSHHHPFHRLPSKDMAYYHNCCHSSCHCSSRRDAPFPNVVPAAQEPSVITDSRLIGHHGLFNHEVKSIDIERLLSKQRKKSGQHVQEKSGCISHPSTSQIPSSFPTNDVLCADARETMTFRKKADPATKARDNCLEKESKISQGSDLTPGQRAEQQLDLSSGSFKSSLSSKHSSISRKGRESQHTPTVDRENVKILNKKVKGHTLSTLEHTPKNQDSPVHQTQAPGLSPSPLQLSSSHSAESFDIRHRRPDSDCVSKTVSAVAAGLCNCLQFPVPRRRSLVAESREVLLKALRERHGPRLQENLLEVQRCLTFVTDPTNEVQDQEPTTVDEDELLTKAFQANTASQPPFETQKTTSLKLTRSGHFNWKSSPQLHKNMKQTAEWLTSPVETSVSLLDDILRSTCSPQFCMDFEPSGVKASDHLFAPSHTSCWEENASASQHWEDRFNKAKSNENVMFGSFLNHNRAVTERGSRSQYRSNIQPFFPYQAQLPHRNSAMHPPREQDPFETDRSSFAPFFHAQICHPQQSTNFEPFSQFSHPSTCPPPQFPSH